jgi:hypothetical protein
MAVDVLKILYPQMTQMDADEKAITERIENLGVPGI